MKESKLLTIKLLSRKISEFKDLAGKTSFHNRHSDRFEILVKQTENLLQRLFSRQVAKDYIKSITLPEDGTAMESEEHYSLRRKKIKITLVTLKKYLDLVESTKT
ncbi:MAG: hypothetical protein WCS77_06330 [Elusimicrobiaceae bacterium]|jgi:hypothetical protein